MPAPLIEWTSATAHSVEYADDLELLPMRAALLMRGSGDTGAVHATTEADRLRALTSWAGAIETLH
eukprot:6568754-Prymnesium_polylepis.1